MGSTGWYVLLHKGRYYRIIKWTDSYPFSLGSWLVDELLNAECFESQIEAWKRLLDLGSVTDWALQIPKDSNELEEWNNLCAGLNSEGPIGRWFINDRSLINDDDEVLFLGCRVMIEYVYLINLDDDEFSALHPYNESSICIYPFQELRDDVKSSKEWVKMFQGDEEGRIAYDFKYMYPWPKSLVDPLQESIKNGGYRVIDTVSESLSAVVYHAQSISDPTTSVYLKIFFSFRAEDESFITWDREIPVAKLIKENPHPNVVTVLETTTFHNHPALVLEPYDGSINKIDLISLSGRQLYVSAIAQVASGVAHLHRLGMVHHDIKPRNILFRKQKDGIQAALCDFESVCVPFIHKIPRWDIVASKIIVPTWRSVLLDRSNLLFQFVEEDYKDYLERNALEDHVESFTSFAVFGRTMGGILPIDGADIHGDHFFFTKQGKKKLAVLLQPNFESVRVPLMFAETMFRQLDWGPYSRAWKNAVDKEWWELPVWENDWAEAKYTEKYCHPKGRHLPSENCGGCSPWILDSYSLRVILDEVIPAEDTNHKMEFSEVAGAKDVALEQLVQKMKSILQNSIDTRVRKGRNLYEKVDSVLPLVVENLEKVATVGFQSFEVWQDKTPKRTKTNNQRTRVNRRKLEPRIILQCCSATTLTWLGSMLSYNYAMISI